MCKNVAFLQLWVLLRRGKHHDASLTKRFLIYQKATWDQTQLMYTHEWDTIELSGLSLDCYGVVYCTEWCTVQSGDCTECTVQSGILYRLHCTEWWPG